MSTSRRYVVADAEPVVAGHGTVIVLGYIYPLGSPECISVCRTYQPDDHGQYVELPAVITRRAPKGPRWRATHEAELRTEVARLLLLDSAWKTVKTRYRIAEPLGHIDLFHLANDGLALAELNGSTSPVPDWCREEVTNDPRYSDENLAIHPFSEWAEAG